MDTFTERKYSQGQISCQNDRFAAFPAATISATHSLRFQPEVRCCWADWADWADWAERLCRWNIQSDRQKRENMSPDGKMSLPLPHPSFPVVTITDCF